MTNVQKKGSNHTHRVFELDGRTAEEGGEGSYDGPEIVVETH